MSRLIPKRTAVIKYSLHCLFCILLVSCAQVSSSYHNEVVLCKEPKEKHTRVEFFPQMPSRVAYRIGTVASIGNGYANFEDLITDAKKKAAKMGGEFLIPVLSGVEKSNLYVPGSTSYDANATVNWGSSNGTGRSTASGYSIGPSVIEVNKPWSVFSVWVYAPVQTGLRLGDNNTILSFHLNSDAAQAGIRVGDTLIGIDGIDMRDEKVIHHMMQLRPGDKLKISVLRDSKRIDRQITALSN